MMRKAICAARAAVGRRILLSGMVVCVLLVAACSSPVDQAERYYQSGMALLEAGELDRAQLEFRNALQLVNDKSEAVYALALIAERQAEWERMFQLLRRVVDQDPEHLDAKVKLGQMLLAGGELQTALEISAQALELDQHDSGALALRAAVLLQLEDRDGAGEHARAALDHQDDNVDALMVLAALRLAENDTGGAIEKLDQALEVSPRNLPVQLLRIQALERVPDLDAVEAGYREVIELFPDAVEIRMALAGFYADQERFDAAEAELREIVRLRPDDLQPKVNLVRFVNVQEGGLEAVRVYRDFIEDDPNDHEVRFALVELQRYLGEHDDARDTLKEILALDRLGAHGVRAMGELAAAALQADDRAQVARYVDEILELDPRNDQGLFLRARLAIDNGQYEDATADLRTLLRETPDSARGHFLLGRAHELSGAPQLAEGQYLRAFHTSEYAVEYGLPFASFLQRRGSLPRAEGVLEDVVRHNRDNIQALEALADVKLARGDLAGADEIANRLADIAEGGVASNLVRAAIDVRERNFEAGILALERAHRSAPGQARPVSGLVRTLITAGQPDEALRFLESVLEARPDHPTALLLRGQVLEHQGQTEQALSAYRHAIARAEDHSQNYVQVARLLSRLTRYDEALDILNDGAVKVADPAALRLMKASIYELAGEIDEAIELYEAIIDNDPRSDLAANNLASLLAQYRDDGASHQRAFALAQRFERSEIPHFIDTWGWANYRMGNYGVAVAAMRRAVEQMPEMPLFRYHLGKSLIASGEPDAARVELQKALALGEDAPFAQLDQAKAALAEL